MLAHAVACVVPRERGETCQPCKQSCQHVQGPHGCALESRRPSWSAIDRHRGIGEESLQDTRIPCGMAACVSRGLGGLLPRCLVLPLIVRACTFSAAPLIDDAQQRYRDPPAWTSHFRILCELVQGFAWCPPAVVRFDAWGGVFLHRSHTSPGGDQGGCACSLHSLQKIE